MRFQLVKVIMKRGKPYYVKLESPTFLHSIPWVAKCLEEHGINSDRIKQYTPVLGSGRTPKKRIFQYKRPKGVVICESCGKSIPQDTNICISCGNIFNKRLLELTNNSNKKNKKR